MIRIEMEVDDHEVRELLGRLEARNGDLSDVMSSIGMEMESRISERFETESDPHGQPWAAWSAATVASYPEDGNARLLDRYGDMLISLSHQYDRNSVAIGFGAEYAVYHEFGTATMPRRGLLFGDPDGEVLAPDDARAVTELLEDWLAGVFDEAAA
ncbi:phage virion morphogenesis protein [Thauera aromatica]|uniref:phage virion morphogenesis protein n=1 Tax=Thauera aromatica TaxID=59405 RepID=UPI001FFD1510|nr:phage virion morphogenesis protein [Thauera aromatica]MCK2095635.1 phage virion morphogenesis protein [Thauera aromatica]